MSVKNKRVKIFVAVAGGFCDTAIDDALGDLERFGSFTQPGRRRLAQEHGLVVAGTSLETVSADLAKALIEANHFCDCPDFMDTHDEPDYASPASVRQFLDQVQRATTSPELRFEEVAIDAAVLAPLALTAV